MTSAQCFSAPRWVRRRQNRETADLSAGCRHFDTLPLFHRQRRRGQNLALLRHGTETRRGGQTRAVGEHGPGVEPRRSARDDTHKRTRAHRGCAGPRCAEHQSRRRRRSVSRALDRPHARPAAGSGAAQHGGATFRLLHGRNRRLRRVFRLYRRSRGREGLRPCHLRHRAHRPHAAPHESGEGMGSVSRHQHQRHLLPRSAGRT